MADTIVSVDKLTCSGSGDTFLFKGLDLNQLLHETRKVGIFLEKCSTFGWMPFLTPLVNDVGCRGH